jgi:alpha-ketoglutaric semialdehyde dehydrogenase
LIANHHGVHGSTGVGRITAQNPRQGFVGEDPERGLFCHPTIVSGVASTMDSRTPRPSAR